MDRHETACPSSPPSLLPATSERQPQTPDHRSPSPPAITTAAQNPAVRAPVAALRSPREEQTMDAPASPTVPSPNPFVGFDDISRHVASSEFDSTSRIGSCGQTKTSSADTPLKTQENGAAVAGEAPPTAGVAETTTPPSVHFPDTLPVPVHEHHHHSHHFHKPHHPNTPASLSPQAANPIEEAADITTPLPSYPSSARISRCSSMRSLIISLESPSIGGSIFGDHHHSHNIHPHHALYDKEGNTSGNFGYKLGRRLDTLVSASSAEEESPTSDMGQETECIHSLRKGTPMKLPLPTLASEQTRGRSPVVRGGSGSSLDNEMIPGSPNEGERIALPREEDPSARLNRMVELQLHRTYEELRRLSEALETCSVDNAQPSTPCEHASLILPVMDGEKHSETILSQNPSTGTSTPLNALTGAFPALHQLVFQRASADPQDLRQLAELNMRLLRNLQVSLRKLDKLRTLVKEQGARGPRESDGTDPEDDDGESDNEVFIPREREGARTQTCRERSESLEKEVEEKEAEGVLSKSTKQNVDKAQGKKSGAITVVTRALGLAKSRTQDSATNITTANTDPGNTVPGVPTGSIATIPICNSFHPGSGPFSQSSAQRRTFSWSPLWPGKKQSIVETIPSALIAPELPFNGMHGSCCTCGDKHRQKESPKERAWTSWLGKNGMGRAQRGVEWVPRGSGGAFWNKERKSGIPLRGV
ncbi:hypothetical protein L211DRAFT_852903 [Terfezia boudieri ATCC MYA-4762]|uniref:Uncharacterized protein n=1 Tax=Terfezia boudieri ATCC MYA-4762 TaxID=1051890 RepID=A0A3N4LA68_9PEZI|nr:hypothetical protein L211DRAFT_852903 [Terfezia boudieri ATCC MYA-4762]